MGSNHILIIPSVSFYKITNCSFVTKSYYLPFPRLFSIIRYLFYKHCCPSCTYVRTYVDYEILIITMHTDSLILYSELSFRILPIMILQVRAIQILPHNFYKLRSSLQRIILNSLTRISDHFSFR